MLGHLGVNVGDLSQARAYYRELMPLVGFESFLDNEDEFAYRPVNGKPGTYLFFYPAAETGQFSRHAPGLQHLAFIVKTRSAVQEVFQAMVDSGSEPVHEPQVFPQYPQPYFAAFWLDPDGVLLEAVCHHDRP
ncbi:MAG: VOC family protein [Acidimicrobiales bacterium]